MNVGDYYGESDTEDLDVYAWQRCKTCIFGSLAAKDEPDEVGEDD
jgi:hypothetical protein